MRGLSTIKWIAKHPLAKGKRAQNIARFLAWQMRSRFIRKPHVYETANGAKMWAIPGATGATGHLYVGLQEFEEMAFLLQAACKEGHSGEAFGLELLPDLAGFRIARCRGEDHCYR